MLLRLFSNLFGYNYQVVKAQTTVSKQKIVTLGTLVLLPIAIWFFSGFYLSHVLFEVNLIGSMAIGIGLGLAILIIDRAFIVLSKDNGGKSFRNFRIIIAVISTILGSLAMDLMIFSQDLAEYRTTKLGEARVDTAKDYYNQHNAEVLRYEEERSQALEDFKNAEASHIAEIEGTSGTGKYGVGPVAAAKKSRMEKAEQKFNALDQQYLDTKAKLETDAKTYAETTVIQEKGAILSKIRDLHYFVFGDIISFIYYVVIFGFFFCLEFFPFKYKSEVSESLFEKMLFAEELMGNQRLEQMMAQRAEILRQDGLLGHRAENIRQLARSSEHIRKIG